MVDAVERSWIRTEEFCEQVRDLRRRGNTYRMIREKLIRMNPELASKSKISDEVLRAAIQKGPIDFFSKSRV
jgi:hypothetical protein